MPTRSLYVVADDFGIGPETSRGILDLMRSGVVTGTVLLVNSPFAEEGVRSWRQAGCPGSIGWHPNLNLDRPAAPADRVPSLLLTDGRFAPLGTMMVRLVTGRLRFAEIVREFDAQYDRFVELTGSPPAFLNGHKHIHVFPIIGRALSDVLDRRGVRPFVRRVVEPAPCLAHISGARVKRAFLSALGALAARRQRNRGWPGNEYLIGVTDPKWVRDPRFFARWLARVPGRTVELAVHPGYRDETLIGRDCTATDGQVERRVHEQRLLSDPEFGRACARAGFVLAPPAARVRSEELARAA